MKKVFQKLKSARQPPGTLQLFPVKVKLSSHLHVARHQTNHKFARASHALAKFFICRLTLLQRLHSLKSPATPGNDRRHWLTSDPSKASVVGNKKIPFVTLPPVITAFTFIRKFARVGNTGGRGGRRAGGWVEKQGKATKTLEAPSKQYLSEAVVKDENLFCFQTSRAEFYLFSLPSMPSIPIQGLPLSRSWSGSFAACKYKLPSVCNGHRASGTGRKGKLLLHFRQWKSENLIIDVGLPSCRYAAPVPGQISSERRLLLFLISLEN